MRDTGVFLPASGPQPDHHAADHKRAERNLRHSRGEETPEIQIRISRAGQSTHWWTGEVIFTAAGEPQ